MHHGGGACGSFGLLVLDSGVSFDEDRADFCIEPKGGSPCCPDANLDGVIDVLDLEAVILAWGADDPGAADVTYDGVVDVSDLTAVLLSWGGCS